MNLIINLFTKIIRKRKLILSNQHLMLAISGGQDSLCLLVLIFVIKNQWCLSFYSTYCNHFWQINSFFLNFHLLKMHYLIKVQIIITVPFDFLKTEDKSRVWRYSQFERIRILYKFDAIITGHTKSDTTETFLFNIFRGCGISHLSSISWKKKIVFKKFLCFGIDFKKSYTSCLYPSKGSFSLIRPLLGFNRYEIHVLTQAYYLPLIIDKTNFKFQYFRNRVRHQLLPLLRFYFNPRIDLTLTRFIQILLPELNFINFLSLKILTKIQFKKIKNKTLSINRSFFILLPSSLKKRILISLLKDLKSENISFDLLEKILKLIFLNSKKNSKSQIYILSRNLLLIFYQNQLIIENKK
jgi:tRNA(Ile)-lysidine synthase